MTAPKIDQRSKGKVGAATTTKTSKPTTNNNSIRAIMHDLTNPKAENAAQEMGSTSNELPEAQPQSKYAMNILSACVNCILVAIEMLEVHCQWRGPQDKELCQRCRGMERYPKIRKKVGLHTCSYSQGRSNLVGYLDAFTRLI